MVLLNDVIEIFDLAELDAGIVFGFVLRVVAFDRRRVGAALVDRDLLWRTIMPAASYISVLASVSPHFDILPARSISPD
jgi:hypothetical protein